MTATLRARASRVQVTPNTRRFWPHVACGVFVVLWLNVGAATDIINAAPGGLKAAIFGLWLALAAARCTPFAGDLLTTVWPLVVLMFLVRLFSAEIAESEQYFQGMSYLLIAFSLFCFYSRRQYARERNVLLLVMTSDFIATGVRTLAALQTDPLLSRYLATTEDNRLEVYGSQSFSGLGGYGFAYANAAIVLVLLFFFFRTARKATVFLAASAGTILVFEMAFTTAITLLIVLGVAFLAADVVPKRGLSSLLFGVALLGWASGLYAEALRSAAQYTFLTQDVSIRLLELATFISGQNTTGSDLGVRLDVWSSSLGLVLTSGVFGLAGSGEPNQATGGHSQWLDLFASYGAWAALFVLFLGLTWTFMRRAVPNHAIKAVARVWVFMLVLGLVNNLLFSTILLTWMFFVPALAQWFAERLPTSSLTAFEPST